METGRIDSAHDRVLPRTLDPAMLLELLELSIAEGRLELPVLSATASELLALTTEAEVDAGRLVALLHRDPAVTAHVMRVANSAAYAVHSPARSLQQAVMRIGVATLGELALAATLRAGVFHVPGHEETLRAIWREAAAAGVYAREIARRAGTSPENAFLAGFLQPIGKPVMLHAAVRLATRAGWTLPPEDALALVDRLHARAGYALASAWGLPAPVVATLAALAGHGTADGAGEVAAAELAMALARRLLASPESDAERDHPAWTELGLSRQDADALLARADVILAVVDALAP